MLYIVSKLGDMSGTNMYKVGVYSVVSNAGGGSIGKTQ
jgi:hypothetical protein